jgi:hypothetical protein
MLQIQNHTPFQSTLAVFPDPAGVECVYGVVKATFRLPPDKVTIAEEQLPLVVVDEFWEDPAKSSIKTPGEMTLTKPATDVLMRGHAISTAGKTVSLDVSLKVGEVQKTVRVFGNRVWKPGLLGFKMSDPEPFEKIPLKYELAFGGVDPQPKDDKKIDYEPRNPVGKGLVPKNSKLATDGIALPNLEDPRELIGSARDRPAPAGFGPLSGHWDPRKSYAGTYDDGWIKKRAPYLPADFNPRFFQCAPPDLIAKGYLKGGEPVELLGVSPKGPLQFKLPVCTLEIIFDLDGKQHRHAPNLDTVFFDPDAGRFWMVWRACQVVDKKLLRMKVMEIYCKEYAKRKVA